MPQVEFDVSCPGCSAVFSVPVELCGEMAECTECSAVFEIPRVGEIPHTLNTDSSVIQGIIPPPAFSGDNTAATNTVKLSRASIGMIPSLKETFTVGQNAPQPVSAPSFAVNTAQQINIPAYKQPVPTPTQQAQNAAIASTYGAQPSVHQTQSQPKMTFAKPPAAAPPSAKSVSAPMQATSSKMPAARAPSSTHTSLSVSAQQLAQSVKLPSWTKVQFNPGEELQSFRDISKHHGLIAVLAALPVLLTVIVMFFAQTQLVVAVLFVIALWITTFISAFIMAKNSAKRALVITNQRTICIIGKDRIELKK
jgi:hypothetical protein